MVNLTKKLKFFFFFFSQFNFFIKIKEILHENDASFSLGKCQKYLHQYFRETFQCNHIYDTIKIYRHLNVSGDLMLPQFRIMISPSPQKFPHVKVSLEIFNQIYLLVNKLKCNQDRNSNRESFFRNVMEQLGITFGCNFLDDSAIESNARMFIFSSVNDLKEALLGL